MDIGKFVKTTVLAGATAISMNGDASAQNINPDARVTLAVNYTKNGEERWLEILNFSYAQWNSFLDGQADQLLEGFRAGDGADGIYSGGRSALRALRGIDPGPEDLVSGSRVDSLYRAGGFGEEVTEAEFDSLERAARNGHVYAAQLEIRDPTDASRIIGSPTGDSYFEIEGRITNGSTQATGNSAYSASVQVPVSHVAEMFYDGNVQTALNQFEQDFRQNQDIRAGVSDLVAHVPSQPGMAEPYGLTSWGSPDLTDFTLAHVLTAGLTAAGEVRDLSITVQRYE